MSLGTPKFLELRSLAGRAVCKKLQHCDKSITVSQASNQSAAVAIPGSPAVIIDCLLTSLSLACS